MKFNFILLYHHRDSSLSRSDRVSASSVVDSVAELRNKYSPANYVPAIYRNKYENVSKSKSINDIGTNVNWCLVITHNI